MLAPAADIFELNENFQLGSGHGAHL
jgi:hypothetical protein